MLDLTLPAVSLIVGLGTCKPVGFNCPDKVAKIGLQVELYKHDYFRLDLTALHFSKPLNGEFRNSGDRGVENYTIDLIIPLTKKAR